MKIKDYLEILFLRDVSIEEYSDDAFAYRLFFEIFKTVPYVSFIYTELDEKQKMMDIDLEKTLKKIAEESKCDTYIWKNNDILLGKSWLIFKGTICSLEEEMPKIILDNVVFKEEKKEANLIFVSISKQGDIIKKLLPISNVDVDVKSNYNDDFKYERLEEIALEDKSSLVLLYGEAGTGKSHILRKLIKDHPEQNFYWLDSSMFSMINSTTFMEFLISCKGGVFILEDCEMVIKDRNTNYNNLITPILNISDGMLGDSLHLKFFCTFNTDLNNIDTALLRKGRLSMKYKFEFLTVDKVQKLFDKLGINQKATKEMPLCDIFNFEVENGKTEKKKIGF